jgi:type II secretory ATPase GspE/PulE/Tfp pilus assembly ATPase PilB-like protein
MLKADMAKKFGVIPVRKEANSLVLAMSDPMDIETMDNVRFITGLTIKPVLAMASEIKDAIRKYYDGESVTRGTKFTIKETVQKAGKMEIVREVPEFEPTDWGQQQAAPHEHQRQRADSGNQKIVLDALITLLVEKELITREELARFIEQKKLGI